MQRATWHSRLYALDWYRSNVGGYCARLRPYQLATAMGEFWRVCAGLDLAVVARKQHQVDKQSDKQRSLNQKDKQLIGQTSVLEQDITRGKCRIKLGDTSWSAYSDSDLPSGTLVKVIDVDGITLLIEKAE